MKIHKLSNDETMCTTNESSRQMEKKSTSKSERILLYDILRILSIFSVILIHVSAENWYKPGVDRFWLENNFLNCLVRWSVPLFVVITGALLLDRENITIKSTYLKYFKKILICLIIWHFFYYFYTTPIFTISSFIKAAKEGILGTTYAHLWYLYLLLGLYALLPILNKLVKALNKKELLYLLIIGFATTSLIKDITLFTNINFTRLIEPYKVFTFSTYIFYFILGYYLKKYKPSNKKINIAMLIISTILLVVVSLYSNEMSIKTGEHLQYAGPESIISVLFIISLFSVAGDVLGKRQNKIVTKLGELTFGVYLIHFWVEKTLLKYGIHANIMSPIVGCILVSILVMVISYIISYIISKIPYVRKAIGL